MATKNYMINDKWLDINKKNIIELQSVDGVIDKVYINGEEAGGGGGSSDFSTAKVTFSGTENSGIDGTQATMPLIISTPFDAILPLRNEVVDETYTIVLYKGKAIINIEAGGSGTTVTTSGNIEVLEGTTYIVTGDCTITISAGE